MVVFFLNFCFLQFEISDMAITGVSKSKDERDKSLTVVWGEVEACTCLGSLFFIELDSLLGKDSAVQFSPERASKKSPKDADCATFSHSIRQSVVVFFLNFCFLQFEISDKAIMGVSKSKDERDISLTVVW